MKKTSFALMLLLLVSALIISACGDSSSDKVSGPPEVTWANSDWDIMFINGEAIGTKSVEFVISAFWMGDPSGVNPDDSASVVIDGTYYQLESFFGMPSMYMGLVNLNPGQTYNVKFIHNGTEKAATDLQMPYACNATFPSTYNPSQSATFSWSLSNNNQYQYAGVSSYNPDEEDEYDDDIKFIKPSARSHTVAANAVDSYGANTEYDLVVGQVTYKKANRISFSSFQGDAAYYGMAKGTDNVSKALKAHRIIKALRNAE